MLDFFRRLSVFRSGLIAVGLTVVVTFAYFAYPKPVRPPQYGRSFSLFDWYRVELAHDGMAPTLVSGDRVVVHGHVPLTGEIALCAHPNGEEYVLGRIIAAGGHTVWADERGLAVENPMGRATHEAYGDRRQVTFRGVARTLARTDRPRPTVSSGETEQMDVLLPSAPLSIARIRVPENHVYLLGDDRGAAEHDSRTFGPVPIDGCLGAVVYRTTSSDDGAVFGSSTGSVD